MAPYFFVEKGRIRPAPETRIIKAPDYIAVGETQKVLDEANDRALQIIREAEKAHQLEKQRGYQEGLCKARQEMAEQITATALRCAQHHRQLKEQTVLLVMEVLKKVLLNFEPRDLVVAQVGKALSGFKGCRQLVLKVNPALAGALEQQISEIMACCPGIGLIHVKAVPDLCGDEVILESETGIVEASMEVQLAAIAEALRKVCD